MKYYKQIVMILLLVSVCGMLWGCGKSEEVKNVETLIEEIGDVTVDSENKIKEAEKAYNALSDKEKEQVENADQLKSKRDELDEIIQKAKEEEERRIQEEKEKELAEKKEKLEPFLGDWKPLYAEIQLKDYRTSTFDEDTVYKATLQINENKSDIEPINETTIKVKSIGELKLVEDNGITKLVSKDVVFVRSEEYENIFNNMFVHVILDENNIGNYIGGPKKVGKFLDEWGEVSDVDAFLISSRAYDNEDLVMLTYDDVKYEIFIDGQSDSVTYYEPYPIVTGYGNPTLNHFGRAQGEIWYVKKEFVSNIEAGEMVNINLGTFEGRVITFSDGFKAYFYINPWGMTDISLMDMGF